MKKKIILLCAMVLLLPLVGCTTPSQWIADAQVDELCAKDGGIKVYETVTLPKERFNQWGQFTGITVGENTKPTDEYYWFSKDTEIPNASGLVITKFHAWVYRRSDQKLLGETISYWRRGGDIPLPAHPSSYGCSKREKDILEEIFLKAN